MARQVKTPYVAQVIDYWTDSALAEAIDENDRCEIMWTRLLSAAKKAKQDGFVPRGSVLALGLTHWKKTLPILVKYGVVLEAPGGWSIPGWLKHNDSQAEIDKEMERKRENIRSWRERNRLQDDSVVGNEPDTNHGRHLTPDTRHLTLDPPNGSKRSRRHTTLSNPQNGSDDEPTISEQTLSALRAAATERYETETQAATAGQRKPIGNREAWIQKTVQDLAQRDGQAIQNHHQKHPELTGAELHHHWQQTTETDTLKPTIERWTNDRITAGMTLTDITTAAHNAWGNPTLANIAINHFHATLGAHQ